MHLTVQNFQLSAWLKRFLLLVIMQDGGIMCQLTTLYINLA